MANGTTIFRVNPNSVTTTQTVVDGSPFSTVRVVQGCSDAQGASFWTDGIATADEYGALFAEIGDALERMTNQARELRGRFDRAFAKIDELAP